MYKLFVDPIDVRRKLGESEIVASTNEVKILVMTKIMINILVITKNHLKN